MILRDEEMEELNVLKMALMKAALLSGKMFQMMELKMSTVMASMNALKMVQMTAPTICEKTARMLGSIIY